MTSLRARRPARRAAATFLTALVLGVAGCGSASAPSPPSGVDGLEIPTPDPDPDDFVASIDNPWLPLAEGAQWDYRVEDELGRHRVLVTVADGPTVAGVTTTEVRRIEQGRTSVAGEVVDYYAQDRDGNVWWFGREDAWRAGEAGAEAGLAMPADPRFGDGFRIGLAVGVDERARVTSVDAVTEVPAGTYDDLVVLEVTGGDVVRTEYYAEGVGLVRSDVAELETTTGLVAYDEPR
jgi:hypothetical protein